MRNRVALIDAESNPLATESAAGESILKVAISSALLNVVYDYFSVTYPSDTQEVYAFKLGGSGGTLVKTITLNYVDASKAQLLNGAAV